MVKKPWKDLGKCSNEDPLGFYDYTVSHCTFGIRTFGGNLLGYSPGGGFANKVLAEVADNYLALKMRSSQ